MAASGPRSPGRSLAALPGWEAEDFAAAWAAFRRTADLIGIEAGEVADPRAAFEGLFEPVPVCPEGAAHFTGYYEPEVPGSRRRSDRFAWPLHAVPAGSEPDLPWHSRAEIDAGELLAGRELVWLESAIEAFLAQVQGSLRVRLAEGGTLRLGYAGRNGHPYRSIGAELARRTGIAPAAMTPEVIRDWCAAHPAAVQALLNHNPSYVFFRPLDLPADSGPPGATGRPVTALRSLAVDPAFVPLGAPVWIDCPGLGSRLMVAQDTGAAIRGAGRGDIFLGTGPEAGRRAGAINAHGSMTLLRRRG